MTWESILDSLAGWLWSALGWIGDAFMDLLDRYVGLDFIAQGVVFVGGGSLLFLILAWLHDRSPRRDHQYVRTEGR